MKKALVILLAGVFGFYVLKVPGRGQMPDNVEKLMRAKLGHSQKVLEALALEDFDAISRNSKQMSLLSQAAQWQVIETDEYRRQSVAFRSAADALTAAGKKKNLDAAALAYVNLTLQCVKCHKYVRSVRMAQTDRPLRTLLEPPSAIAVSE